MPLGDAYYLCSSKIIIIIIIKLFNKLKLNSKKPYLDCPQTAPIWVTLV
jgi:hypothetical protein